jgi:hypothetical protein
VFPVPVAEALARRSFFGQGTTDLVVTPEDYQAKNRQANEIIRRVAAERAIVLDPAEVLTDANGNWVAQIDGEALYHDSSHLSGAGGRLLAPLFERLFQELGLGDPSLP